MASDSYASWNQDAAWETRISEIGPPNKSQNAIIHEKPRSVYRRFGRVRPAIAGRVRHTQNLFRSRSPVRGHRP
jgi:hypothetical protein